MTSPFHRLLASVALAGFVAFSTSDVSGAVALVENGVAKADVVLAADASADEQSAATELVHYIEKITGAQLPIRATARRGRSAVLVGLSVLPEATRARLRRVRGEGFIVEAGSVRVRRLADEGSMVYEDSDAVVLAGTGPQGTSFAVYEFLERFAGVRWLWPGEVGEVVPPQKSLAIKQTALLAEPAFLWRNLGPGGTLWGPTDRWQKERELGVSLEHQATMRLWERRNRFGGEKIYGGHASAEILPPEIHGPQHPEYYALVSGKRDWENFNGKHRAHLCTSNPEVVQKVIEYCRRMFDQHPDFDGVSISPNDGRGFCECARCTALDTGRTQEEDGDPGVQDRRVTRIITDRMVRFGNEVAEAVGRTHPGKKILMYSYSQFHTPPERVRVRSNLLILYTVNSAAFWNQEAREEAFQEFAGWRRMAPTFGVYEYMTQNNFPDMPRLIPDLIKLELNELQRIGSRHYQAQAGNGFAVNGLNFYVLGKLLWDPSLDVKAIQHDYTDKAFGPAAAAMNRYYDRLIADWRGRERQPVRMLTANAHAYGKVLGIYPRDLRGACRRDLDEALRLATGEYRRRVKFVSDGFRYFEMTIAATEATLPLLEAGWKPGKPTPTGVDQKAVARALDKWRQRDRYVEQHREDFALSYLWIQSNNELTSFNPRRRAEGN